MLTHAMYVDNLKYIPYILFTVVDFMYCYLCLFICRIALGRK